MVSVSARSRPRYAIRSSGSGASRHASSATILATRSHTREWKSAAESSVSAPASRRSGIYPIAPRSGTPRSSSVVGASASADNTFASSATTKETRSESLRRRSAAGSSSRKLPSASGSAPPTRRVRDDREHHQGRREQLRRRSATRGSVARPGRGRHRRRHRCVRRQRQRPVPRARRAVGRAQRALDAVPLHLRRNDLDTRRHLDAALSRRHRHPGCRGRDEGREFVGCVRRHRARQRRRLAQSAEHPAVRRDAARQRARRDARVEPGRRSARRRIVGAR
jgi:hypothetical protein